MPSRVSALEGAVQEEPVSDEPMLHAVTGGSLVRLELHVQDDSADGPLVVEVRGWLDSGTAGTLRAASRFFASHPGVIVDLRSLEGIEQAGLGALTGLIRSVHENGGAVVLVSERPNIDVVLRDAGLDRAAPVVTTVSTARQAIVTVPSH